MIAIVDYGLGNVRAFENIYRALGIPVSPARDAADLESADHVILPGVGAFDWAVDRLDASGMRQTLERRVLQDRIPVLGVCVGMQMMARRSDEGTGAGLGWVEAEVRRLDAEPGADQLRLPHMGWNDVEIVSDGPLFKGMGDSQFYFLHSYCLVPDDAGLVSGRTTYGASFASAISAGNIFGTQFHPEKSHDWGVKLLMNFAEI